MKVPEFGTKNALFWYFWLEFYKTIVIFKISTLKFVINLSLIHTVNFGMGLLFLNVRGPLLLKVRVRVRFIKYALQMVLQSSCSHALVKKYKETIYNSQHSAR